MTITINKEVIKSNKVKITIDNIDYRISEDKRRQGHAHAPRSHRGTL